MSEWKADGISMNGVSLCIEHLPDRKRPLLVSTINGDRMKVAEVTDEAELRIALGGLFASLDFVTKKVVGE